jgi:hypothetical protein
LHLSKTTTNTIILPEKSPYPRLAGEAYDAIAAQRSEEKK